MFRQSILAAAFAAIASSAMAAPLPLYSTGFESGQGFAANVSVAGVNGWTVPTTPATVTAGTGAGSPATGQFIQLGAGAVLERAFTGTDAYKQIWVEGYFQGRGSSVTLANANYETTGISVIVHFSETNGIEMENGNRNSTVGTPVATGVALGAANENRWYKITLRLNFATASWDLWVDNVKRNATALGFRDGTVTKLNGFKNLAQTASKFDEFRVVSAISGDTNGDAVIDAADVVEMIDLLAGAAPTDPIVLNNSDLDTNGSLTNADLVALRGIIIGS